jgi:hypothetical protein
MESGQHQQGRKDQDRRYQRDIRRSGYDIGENKVAHDSLLLSPMIKAFQTRRGSAQAMPYRPFST